MNLCRFESVKQVAVSGDIHGDFEGIFRKISGFEDLLLIVAGDCGFGFETKERHLLQLQNLSKKYLVKGNNYVAFVRGNHDNPAYFEPAKGSEKTPVWLKHCRTIPDYVVIEAAGLRVLCLGGAVSIDRRLRKRWMVENDIRPDGPFDRSYYWPGELPLFAFEALGELCRETTLDAVVSHTAPSFCAPITKDGIMEWTRADDQLYADVTAERRTLDEVYAFLKEHRRLPKEWFYGHYHFSSWQDEDGCHFRLLDIEEIAPLSLRCPSF